MLRSDNLQQRGLRNSQKNRRWWQGSAALPIVFLLLVASAHSQIRANVAQANLNYLVEHARTIVQGYVVSAVLEPHPQFANLQTVVVTIAVAKSLKGEAATRLRFRQYVGSVKNPAGAGDYHKAEEVLLFLNPTSLYGLTSPVGMEQGLFRVVHDDKGNRYAVNGRGNIGLFRAVLVQSAAKGVVFSARAKAMLSKNGGRVSLDTLEETIQALVAVRP